MPKAKELRPFVERLITVAKRGLAAGEANGRVLNARRLVMQTCRTARSSRKLFDTIAPRFAARPGGYTRLLRIGFRRGDSAEVAQVELVGSEFNPNAKTEAPAEEAEAEGQGRRRTAARRRRAAPRHKKGDDDSRQGDGEADEGRGTGARSTTPRKAGGS